MSVKSFSPQPNDEEKIIDSALRPRQWDHYIGQERIKKNLKVMINAAKERKESPDHILLYGPAGLGKTTLALLIAQDSNTNIKITSGPVIERAGDLVAILTNLNEGDILFIDECHRLNRFVEEYLYSAMEDFKMNLILGKGPLAQSLDLKIPRFTLIGATTRLDLMSSPLRSRFGAVFQLNYYEQKELEEIIKRSAKLLNVEIEKDAIEEIAKRSRCTPRIANKLLKRVRDFAQIEGQGKITKDIADKSLNFLEIDKMGLEIADRKILETIINKFNGGPAGLQALSAATSEEKNAILDIYEPYLIQLGLIKRTHKGRNVTKLAYDHLGIKCSKEQEKLL
ncbi:MAG: Holliday junction branch migration DNA helicase RuvB [Candidatus Pacebacteria bacterium]|nr:Holliday junction branch migration DNA helicase RuvB [Candidatus Paceibacterota bacterium]